MKTKDYGKCQVCGATAQPGRKNCSLHAHVQERTALLAQWAHELRATITITDIHKIAERFKVTETTVRQHLKREGFAPIREWRNNNDK